MWALVDCGDQITNIYQGQEKNGPRSQKSTTKVQAQASSLLNSLVECTALSNTVTKCGGIESGEDPKNTLLNSERQRSPEFTRAHIDENDPRLNSASWNEGKGPK